MRGTYSTRVNGKTIISKVKESTSTTQLKTGSNMKDSLDQEIGRVLGNCFTKMEISSRVSFAIICYGAREGCSTKPDKSSKQVCGRRECLYLNCDIFFYQFI